MSNINDEKSNPWTSIWFKPRKTIQQIVDTNPEQMVLMLAGLSGISQVLSRASMRNAGDTVGLSTILSLAIILGPIGGIISLYISSALLKWTGKWIGGRATVVKIRAANAWASLPSVVALIFWFPQLAVFGREIFMSSTPTLDATPALAFVLLICGVSFMILGVWQIIIGLNCLAQVQEFSVWKALGNIILAFLVIFVPLLLLIIPLGLISG